MLKLSAAAFAIACFAMPAAAQSVDAYDAAWYRSNGWGG